MDTLSPVISVIIPVYNAADTLYVCLDSLQSQAYRHLELIFINDCSTDDSLTVIQEFADSLSNDAIVVKILNHEQNKGVASARNTGLDNATGQYIYYVDADDSIEADAIALLVRTAMEHDADIIGCNWFLTFNKNERRMNQPSFTTPYEGLIGILNGSMRWNLWLFLVRRSLYEQHGIRFIPGMDMGEDLMVMCKLFSHAQKVQYVDKPLYHYMQRNESSLTKLYSENHITQVTHNVIEIEKYLKNSIFVDRLGGNIFFLKLNIKLPLLISDSSVRYQKWLTWFPEANGYIRQNKTQAYRTRLLQVLALRKQFWALRLYYWIIFRVVYGVLYK